MTCIYLSIYLSWMCFVSCFLQLNTASPPTEQFFLDSIGNSQNNSCLVFHLQDIPILMKSKHPTYITVFRVISSYDNVIPLFGLAVWVSLHFNLRRLSNVKSIFIQIISCPVGWSCRIHRLLLCRGVRPLNECPRYDTKQSDDEVPAMLGPWGIRSTPSMPLLPGPLWSGRVAPDRALSMG